MLIAGGLLNIRFVSGSDVDDLRSVPIDALLGIVMPIGDCCSKGCHRG